MENSLGSKQIPQIFMSWRHPFDSIPKMITLALPTNWLTPIAEYNFSDDRFLRYQLLDLINQSTHFIAIWSPENRNSSLVNQEIGAAIHKGIPVLTLVQKGMSPEAMLRGADGIIYDPANPLDGIIQLINTLDQRLISEGYESLERTSALQRLNRAWDIYRHWLKVRL